MTLSAQPASPDYATARFNMVESQVRPNKVMDLRILDALSMLPRELFVPAASAGIAYIDEDIAVAPHRYLLEPMILARLVQEATIRPTDLVMDIAPATGYSTALLAALAAMVVGVEPDDALATKAIANLASLNIKNADIRVRPMAQGAPAKGPYNVIIINGAMEIEPAGLFDQLAEGGRLLGVMRHSGPGHAAHVGEARLFEKLHGHISQRPLFDANVKLLPEFAAKPTFFFG